VFLLKLIDILGKIKPIAVIYTGDGINPEKKIIGKICENYDGQEKIIWFPRTIIRRESGFGALKGVKQFGNRGFSLQIFLVDGEYITDNVTEDIRRKFREYAININRITQIQDALLVNCSYGNININLYCIILGPTTCVEEGLARLVELELGAQINLSGNRDKEWRNALKKEIKRVLQENSTNYKNLIKNSNSVNLLEAYPNICAVFKDIEENY